MRTLPATNRHSTSLPRSGGVSATAAPVPPAADPQLDPIVAQALFAAWSGDPAIVVSSPPGAGKTRLVTHLGKQLSHRAGLDVAIAAQTRAQALAVANRSAAAGAAVTLLGRTRSARPAGLHSSVQYAAGSRQLNHGVTVATTARWLWTEGVRECADVLLVDEAWQLTFADLGALGMLAHQVVLVGDPGQIAPVVTATPRRWESLPTGPHRPAPDALAAAHGQHLTALELPHTWRLGPATTNLIQPVFYPQLPFTSKRPHTALHLADGEQPEVSTVAVNAGPHRADPALIAATVQRARHLCATGTVATAHESRTLRPADIAIVVPHVDQASLIAAHLTDLSDLFVGTINQAQGLERDAVIAIHPLAGYRHAPAFATDTSRLCVALSRHRAHLTLIMDTTASATLNRAHAHDPSDTAVARQRDVLAALLAD